MTAEEGSQQQLSWRFLDDRPGWRSALVLPVAAICVARATRAIRSAVCGVLLCVIAQFLTYATWLPFARLIASLSR